MCHNFMLIIVLLLGYKVQAKSSKPSSVITLSRHSVSVKNSSGDIPAVILQLNGRLRKLSIKIIYTYIYKVFNYKPLCRKHAGLKFGEFS